MPINDEKERLFLSSQVSQIVDIPLRRLIDFAEKNLIQPKRPAIKSGHRRQYDYLNLLELSLAKTLLDIFNLQFFMCRQIMRALKVDGDLQLWAAGEYGWLSIYNSEMSLNDPSEELIGSHTRTPVHSARPGDGTFYLLIFEHTKSIEYTRIISPWRVDRTFEALEFAGHDFEGILGQSGMVAVNLGLVREKIEARLLK
jgi:hypothetical protein